MLHPSPFLWRGVKYTSRSFVSPSSLLSIEMPLAGSVCCLLVIVSTDSIFTAFSIYKIKSRVVQWAHTPSTYTNTDQELRSVTFWLPSCMLLTSHKHPADILMLPIRLNALGMMGNVRWHCPQEPRWSHFHFGWCQQSTCSDLIDSWFIQWWSITCISYEASNSDMIWVLEVMWNVAIVTRLNVLSWQITG
jgi:hypothetical protein